MKITNKNFYIAATVEQNEKFYSYVIKINSRENMLNNIAGRGVVYAHICATKKEACELVTAWREAHKRNGSYMFSK